MFTENSFCSEFGCLHVSKDHMKRSWPLLQLHPASSVSDNQEFSRWSKVVHSLTLAGNKNIPRSLSWFSCLPLSIGRCTWQKKCFLFSCYRQGWRCCNNSFALSVLFSSVKNSLKSRDSLIEGFYFLQISVIWGVRRRTNHEQASSTKN